MNGFSNEKLLEKERPAGKTLDTVRTETQVSSIVRSRCGLRRHEGFLKRFYADVNNRWRRKLGKPGPREAEGMGSRPAPATNQDLSQKINK
jgi:hypothetical protein